MNIPGTEGLARFLSSSFVQSTAGDGGALHLSGEGSATVQNCMFEGSTAFNSGGAILFSALGALSIQLSVFQRNSVRVDRPVGVGVTVRVYTGDTGTDELDAAYAFTASEVLPVWKIDGVTPSQMDGSVGSEVVYGNVSYHTRTQYSTRVTLSQGRHTPLRAGDRPGGSP